MLMLAGSPIGAQSSAQEPPGETYIYKPDGRRDPFLTLVGRIAEPRPAPSRRGDGPAAMLVSEVSLRGVMESGGHLVAMIKGTDGRSYLIRPGDAFMDATVKAITLQGLVLLLDDHDSLPPGARREVLKLLRSAEDSGR
jgi:hypothetical protein